MLHAVSILAYNFLLLIFPFLCREIGVNSKLSQIEYDPWLCAKNCALTWLPLDFVSGIPFHIINYLFEGDSAPVLKVVKSLRLLRILKLTRLFKLEHMVQHSIARSFRYFVLSAFEK